MNGMRYARHCARDVVRYRAHKMGLGSGDLAFNSSSDDFEDEDFERVHNRILNVV